MTEKAKLADLTDKVNTISLFLKKVMKRDINNKDMITGGFDTKTMYAYIEKCIAEKKQTFLYCVVLDFENNSTNKGNFQNDILRTNVAKIFCEEMNAELDTIAGSLSLRTCAAHIIIGIITQIDSCEYIQRKLDDIYPDITEIHIGETIIYETDNLRSVIARIELATLKSKMSKHNNYTRIYKHE